jgi:hypothetical protein
VIGFGRIGKLTTQVGFAIGSFIFSSEIFVRSSGLWGAPRTWMRRCHFDTKENQAMFTLKYMTAVIIAFAATPAIAGDLAKANVKEAYAKYVNGIAAGDAKMAASAYDENAFMIAGECTPEAPCKEPGKAKATVEGWVAIGLKEKSLGEPQVLGNMLVERGEVSWQGIEKEGLQRMVGTTFVEAENGLITRKIFIPDTNDEQTRKYVTAAGQ